MITKILTDSSESLEIAAEFLKDGKTVVFPTETVYGLGANALDENAVKKIFKAKGRPSDNPLIVHISSLEMLDEIAEDISDTARQLIDKYWPGPLTLIFKKKKAVPRSITAGLETVAVRFPSNNIAYELIEKAGIPVAAPSANLSGKPSPTRFTHAFEDLNGRVDAMIKSAPCEVGVESTVLDVSGEIPILLRPGMITFEELKEVVGEVRLGAFDASKDNDKVPMSPGVKYKHYAPNAEVIILKGSISEIKKYVLDEIERCASIDSANQKREKKLAVLNFEENIPEFKDICTVMSLGSRENPDEVTAKLFNCLRELDDMNVDIIYAPEIPDTGKWRAVQNRLYKSAGGNIIELTEAITENIAEKNKEMEIQPDNDFSDEIVNKEISKDSDLNMKNSNMELKEEAVDVNSAEEIQAKEKSVQKSDENIKESKNSNKDNKMKFLFICTGNTCRSPMAEMLFNTMAVKLGVNAISLSAGTYAYNNLPVSENAVKAMKEIGLDISRHKSRQITREMIADADLVLTMTNEHSEFLNNVVPEFSSKIMTVAKYIDLDISVEDPYGDRLEEYIRCRNQLEKIIKLIFIRLKKTQKV